MNWVRRYVWPIKSEREHPKHNPLAFVALITALGVGAQIYRIVWLHQVGWPTYVALIVGSCFLIGVAQKTRIAWSLGMLNYSCVPLLDLGKNYQVFDAASSTRSYAVITLALGLWLTWLGYLTILRKPYYRYLEHQSSPTAPYHG